MVKPLTSISVHSVSSVGKLLKPLLVFLLVGVASIATAAIPDPPEWHEAYPPFHIAGPLYYVGTKDLAVYLIVTPEGSILINSTLEDNVPKIQASVAQLGFKFSDIKILLISHAHWDHCAASARIKELTGASYQVMDSDVSVVESGGRTDFEYGEMPATYFPPTKVDRVLHDSDKVELGGVTLVAHLTPGHTKGCTTWTMKVTDSGRELNAVIVGSPNVNEGFNLVNDPNYPDMAADYQRGFDVLKSLPCDLFLGAHGSYFGMLGKLEHPRADGANVFLDPDGYKKWIAEKEQAYLSELAKQKAAAGGL